ncbi:phage protein NinX family protein [Citrobacter portucalensis]|uniref:phage protein NinX family protein n=1 Tax=Citrobacter portucalensis TaxID=1639133 RepID=UPI00312C75EC
MDYSKLSDAEINWKVAFHIGLRTVEKAESGDFNPCSNPSDAWPIIIENMISLCAYKRANPGMKEVSWWEADNFCEHITRDDNPLRAAMIVFLMMQDSANVQDNTA